MKKVNDTLKSLLEIKDQKEQSVKLRDAHRFEIKHSMEAVPQQCRHLLNEQKCRDTEHRYGRIIGRYVIYRGSAVQLENVTYLNVEEYLKQLL